MRRLLTALGRPQDRLPPVIHVAGTNGKGSTCAYMRAALEASGRRVHVFTSPHLVRFNERIRLAGNLIEDAALVAILEEVERVNAGEPITFFEITGAAAFLAFARTPADALILEVGMGGRLDATNVVERPVATAITPVSMDHMSYLGDTIAAIAREKAGILKRGVLCALGRQTPEGLAVIEAQAAAVGAPLRRIGREWSVTSTPAGLRYEGARWRLDLPVPALLGRHQHDNAGLAVATLEATGWEIAPDALARGLTEVDWPARMQRLRRGPLVDRLPAGSELWLDGGNNPAAGEVVAAIAAGWRDRPLHLVMGILANRAPEAYLAPIAPHVASLVAVPMPADHAGHTPEAVREAAGALAIPSTTATDVTEAVSRIAVAAGGQVRILICGSLYLAGIVLAENG